LSLLLFVPSKLATEPTVPVHNGILQNGKLHNGTFPNGAFHNGTLQNGTLQNGTALQNDSVTKQYST
jgi:hypothetical protein